MRVCILTILFNVFFIGCASAINYHDMNLTANNNEQQILNLVYYGDNDEKIIRQCDYLMKNGFLNTDSEEYGYYFITYRSGWPYKTGLGATIGDSFAAAGESFAAIGGVFYLSFNYTLIAPLLIPFGLFMTVPPAVIFTAGGIVISAVTPPLLLFGVPFEVDEYKLRADLYIFDSSGNLVRHFEKFGSFKQAVGLYYGHNPTKKAAAVFSGLFEEIFQTVNTESGEINQLLRNAGPVTEYNKTQAMENIFEYLINFKILPSGNSTSYSPSTGNAIRRSETSEDRKDQSEIF